MCVPHLVVHFVMKIKAWSIQFSSILFFFFLGKKRNDLITDQLLIAALEITLWVEIVIECTLNITLSVEDPLLLCHPNH